MGREAAMKFLTELRDSANGEPTSEDVKAATEFINDLNDVVSDGNSRGLELTTTQLETFLRKLLSPSMTGIDIKNCNSAYTRFPAVYKGLETELKFKATHQVWFANNNGKLLICYYTKKL